ARHMRRRMAADAGAIPLFAGVAEVLRQLQQEGVTIAVVSSNSEANVRGILGANNAARVTYFRCGASLFGKAGHFRHLLRQASVHPGRASSFGDEARAIGAARAVGIAAAAVTWGYARRDLLLRPNPPLILDSIEQTPAAVTAGRA